MTFVVGLMCHIGLVLCSDSQESDGISKKNVPKLAFSEREGKWGVAWGCSGDSDIISKFTKHMYKVLMNEPDGSDLMRLQELVESVGLMMKQKYPKAGLSFVCGIWQEHKELAFRLHSMDTRVSNCLNTHDDYACVGMDTSLAVFTLDTIHNPALAIGEGIGAAVFTLKLVKDTADGVGGPTQLLTYRLAKSQWREYEQGYIDGIEAKYKTEDVQQFLRDYWGKNNPSWMPPLN